MIKKEMDIDTIESTDFEIGNYVARKKRNEVEDMQEAIALFYEFRERLNALHPTCAINIENMVQRKN